MRKIIREIADIDKRFAPIIEQSIKESTICDLATKKPDRSHFESLVTSVTSQQVSNAAAKAIRKRLISECGKVTPVNIAKLSESQMRGAGLSAAKVKTIKGLADASLNKVINFNKLHEQDDDEVYRSLTNLWGIGPWTVDMFMMFQLGRLNIWPVGDLGVRRGWEQLHNLKEEISPAQLIKKGEKFAPYRSVVAWYCWRVID